MSNTAFIAASNFAISALASRAHSDDKLDTVLTFADGASADIGELLTGAAGVIEWIAPGSDALGHISQRIAGRRVETLHLVAHGRAGAMWLGGQWIDAAALTDAQALLACWDVDTIVLWSCGAGEDGLARRLASLTGARVFASAADLGWIDGRHNWELIDVDSGAVAPACLAPFDSQVRQAWPHRLAKLAFVNAYRVNTASTPAGKEANSVQFSTVALEVVRIDDRSGGVNFSGNDVIVEAVIDGVTYFGWISRPIKSGGVVRGFYFWTDPQFTNLANATIDGNADGDGNAADNLGFVLVVDQAWFDAQASVTGSNGAFKQVGTSSDRVDSGLNALLAINSAPTLANDAATLREDGGPQTGNVLANDTDANNDALSVTSFKIGNTSGTLGQALTIAGVGSFTLSADGHYSFTPDSNYAGPVPTITYTVTDGRGGSAQATLVLTVAGVNDAPAGTDKTIVAAENTSYVFSVADFGMSDPVDTPANTLAAVRIVAISGAGSLTLNGVAVNAGTEVAVADIGKLVFTPAADQSGAGYASFTFQVRDNGGTASGGVDLDQSPNTITFNVTNINSAPKAVGDSAGTTVGAAAASGNLLANDSDPDAGDTLSVATASGKGNAVAVSNGTAIAGTYGSLTVSSNGSYSYAADASNAAVRALGAGGSLVDHFTYTIKDAKGLTSSATLTVNVNGVNDAVVAVNDFAFAVASNLGSAKVNPSGNVLGNDYDPDAGDTMTVTRGSAGATLGGTIVTIGTTASAAGTESRAYGGFQTQGAGNLQAGMAVSGVGVPANTTVASVTNSSGTRTVVFSNSFGGLAALDNVTSLTIGSNSYTIDARVNPSGTVIGLTQTSGTFTVGMNVTGTGIQAGSKVSAVGTSSNASGGVTFVTLDKAITGTMGTDVEFSGGQTVIVGSHGTLTLGASGAYSYTYTDTTPAAGTDVFTYEVRDASGALSTAKLTIDITASNVAPPTANADAIQVNEDGPAVNANVLANDVQSTGTKAVSTAWTPSASAQTIVTAGGVTLAGAYGTLTIASNGNYTYVADNSKAAVNALPAGATLVDTFYYRMGSASDGYAATALTVTINGANDVPVALADTATAREAGAIAGLDAVGNVTANDSDPDTGAVLRILQAGTTAANTAVPASSTSANGIQVAGAYGTFAIGADGSYRYVVDNTKAAVQALNAGDTLTEVFTYQVSDGAASATQTLTITIGGANDAPTIVVGAGLAVAENAGASFTGIGVHDVDDTSLSVTLSVANGTLSIGTLGAASIGAGANGSAGMTLTGSPAALNAALSTLSYQGAPDFSGTDLLRIAVTDGGGLVASNTVGIAIAPDNRALAVSGGTVNEASPYAMFTVTGSAGQLVLLDLATTGSGSGHADAGTDFLARLEYFDGSSWQTYLGTPARIPSGGSLLVRTPLLNDLTPEGSETFSLRASNRAGASTSANATIVDDGSGLIYDGGVTNGVPDSSAAVLDDDRALAVSSSLVNENSPYAMFQLSGAAGQRVALALVNGNASNADHGTTIEYFDGASWQAYAGPIVLPAEGRLALRVAIVDDAMYEGAESFGVVATNGSGRAFAGTATIIDDGTGLIYPGTLAGGDPVSSASGLDNDLAVAVTSYGPVNEGSAYAVFSIAATAGEVLNLVLGTTGVKPADISGFALEFSTDGSAWTAYDASTQPVVPPGGTVFVRVAIGTEQDNQVEGEETFLLTASTGSGAGAAGSAIGTIVDDGTGAKYTGAVSAGIPQTETTGLDHDQAPDTTSPTIAISGSTASLGVGQSATLTFTLSEASTDFTENDIAVSGGTLSNFTAVSPTVYTATFTPAADSTANGVVSVASSAFSDAAGNVNTDGADADNSYTFSVNTVIPDTTAPTIAISGSTASLGVGQSATLTFTLSEASSDFTENDIAVSGGTLSNFTAVSSTVYTATFTPAANSTANGVVSVASGAFSDAAGNQNADGADADNTYTFSVNTVIPDTTSPTIAISGSTASLGVGQSATLTFTLSEASTDFTENDIAVSGGTLSNFTAVSPTVYTATFTPAADSTANGVVSVASGAFADAAGNQNADGADVDNSYTFSVNTVIPDTTTPTIAISGSMASLGVGQSATLTFTLSEASTDFTENDIAVSGGTLSNFTAVSPTVYTATFTPAADSTANGVVSVASGAFSDAAGNQNADGADADNSYTFSVNTVIPDTTAPTIAISGSTASLGVGQSATLTFTLSEASSDFALGDIAVSGGTLSNFTAVSPTVYTATFTPDADSIANGVISVASGAFSDAAGNQNADGADADNSYTFNVNTVIPDTTAPTITISGSTTNLGVGQSATLTFTLSEASTDFTENDITVSGGTLSNFTAVSPTVYTATFTPAADSTANGVVSVSSGAFSDAAGNVNTDGADADNSYTFSVNTVIPDTTAPTIAISGSTASLGVGQSATLTFTLSEASSDFTENDIAVSGGTLSNFTAVSPTVYTATFTPAANSTANGVVSVASGAFSDAAGNQNADGADADNRVTITIATGPLASPTVTILEDEDNNGLIDRFELSGDIDVVIGLPAGAAAGDTLSITDGTTVRSFVLNANDIAAGSLGTSFAAPAVNQRIAVSASVRTATGVDGAVGSDEAVRGSGVALEVTAITPDTGVVGDFITTESRLQFTGTAESGTIVVVELNGEQIATVIAVDDRWTYDNTDLPLKAGDNTLTIINGDRPEDRSTILIRIFSAQLDPESDDGVSNTDLETSIINPNFVLRAENILAVGDTAQLLAPDGHIVGSMPVGQGNIDTGKIDVPTEDLDDGVYTFMAQIVDAAGNVKASQPVAVTIVTDRDGVMPSVELAATGGDFNRDGILDWQQNNVATLPLASIEAFLAGKNAPSSAFGAIMAGGVGTGNGNDNVVLDAQAQLLDVHMAAPSVALPGNVTAATPLIAFTVTHAENGVLTDIAPSRPGLQTRVVIDLPTGVRANTYLKFDKASGSYFHFLDDQKLDTFDDGATLLDTNGDGLIDRIVLILTDGAKGDADGIANGMIVDPGLLAQENDPVYSVRLANGDRYYTTDAREAATVARGTNNIFEGARFDSLGADAGGQHFSTMWQPFTNDYWFGAAGQTAPYACYELVPTGSGFMAALAGSGIGQNFHLYQNAAGQTQLLTQAQASSLGLLSQGFVDRGAQFSSTVTNAFTFDVEGYLIANKDDAATQQFVQQLASQYAKTSDLGFIEAVEQHYLAQLVLVGARHGGVASADDLNSVFGTHFS